MLKSIRNCHYRGLDSVAVGDRMRVFIATEEITLTLNERKDGPYSVVPHQHSYDITLIPISGRVWNHKFIEDEFGDISLYSIEVYTALKDGVNSLDVKLTDPKIKQYRSETKLLTERTTMKAEEYHTVSCNAGSRWLVCEGDRRIRPLALSTFPGILMYAGLYTPMSDELEQMYHKELLPL